MSLQNEIISCWRDHGDNPQGTFEKVKKLISEAGHDEEVSKLNRLVVHLFTDHLKTNEGVQDIFTELNLKATSTETKNEINRNLIFLNYFNDPKPSLVTDLSVTDSVYVHSATAAAYANLKKWKESQSEFAKADEFSSGLEKGDTSIRHLAITGNNIACALEEKELLENNEAEFLIIAARCARKNWELAGTWLEVERAEYRLSKAFLKIRDYISSIKHANLCLTICENNKAEALEFFFAYEAIASIEKSTGQQLRSLPKMRQYFSLLSSEDQKWCADPISALEK